MDIVIFHIGAATESVPPKRKVFRPSPSPLSPDRSALVWVTIHLGEDMTSRVVQHTLASHNLAIGESR